LSTIGNPPRDVGVIRSRRADTLCEETSRPWVLAATTIGSAMVFIDSTVTNVALPRILESLGATAADSQWIVESYALFLSTLILAAAKHRRGEENSQPEDETVPV
jgi:hypothetical protein